MLFDDLVQLGSDQHDERRVVNVEHEDHYARKGTIGGVVRAEVADVEREEEREDKPQSDSDDRAGADPLKVLLDVRCEVVDKGKCSQDEEEKDRPLHDVPDELENEAQAHEVSDGTAQLGAEDDEPERKKEEGGDP